MGAFEFDNNTELSSRSCGCGCGCGSNAGTGEVCIIAQKIFDQCRIQKCLTPDILGPARAARNGGPGGNDMICEGDIIIPPCNATDVIIKHLILKKIEIIRKTPSSLQTGCWDIELRYVFEYTLEFRRSDGCFIGRIDATSSYTLKTTLFGSTEAETTTVNEMFNGCFSGIGGPYVVAEGKALALDAELKYASPSNNNCCCCCCSCICGCESGCGCDNGGNNGCNSGCNNKCNDYCDPQTAPVAVNVTIGLFTIIKLYRPVNMVVQSLGTCLPESCVSPLQNGDPCGNFNAMSFPWDAFVPSQEPKSCCAYTPSYSSPNCDVDDKDNCVNNCNNNCNCNNRCNCR